MAPLRNWLDVTHDVLISRFLCNTLSTSAHKINAKSLRGVELFSIKKLFY